ncbi:MAG: lipid-A-disaccharide synthase [Cytophagales bacterium]|nr:lipid-A-disaccharide synthase [Cytophagales bacterium]
MRYYLIAGERSGDLHGSNLVKALTKKDPNAVFRGFGGDLMKDAGVSLSVHYDQMAFMGFVTLLANYGTIRRMLRLCKEDILQFKPDVVILIDYGGFNRRIAKFTKPRSMRTFYYIPPKVWAWYQSRAKELKANVDRMFVILPFEKEFYKKYDWEVDYVGNPVLDAIKAFSPDPDFAVKHGLSIEKPVVALLPGSRKMELLRSVPVLAKVARKHPEFQFVVAAVAGVDVSLYQPLREVQGLQFVQGDTYNLLHVARAAIVTSGTATLETGLLKVPQVCIYKAGWLEMKIGKAVVQVKFISLINLIAGKEVIRELIQEEASAGAISAELSRLSEDAGYREAMIHEYEKIYQLLNTGSASENTAALIVKYLNPAPGSGG